MGVDKNSFLKDFLGSGSDSETMNEVSNSIMPDLSIKLSDFEDMNKRIYKVDFFTPGDMDVVQGFNNFCGVISCQANILFAYRASAEGNIEIDLGRVKVVSRPFN